MSCLRLISANSLTDSPNESAMDFCAITFLLAKASLIASCLPISFDKPAKSPVKANSLAFSKFNSLPVNNSAFNSFSIED